MDKYAKYSFLPQHLEVGGGESGVCFGGGCGVHAWWWGAAADCCMLELSVLQGRKTEGWACKVSTAVAGHGASTSRAAHAVGNTACMHTFAGNKDVAYSCMGHGAFGWGPLPRTRSTCTRSAARLCTRGERKNINPIFQSEGGVRTHFHIEGDCPQKQDWVPQAGRLSAQEPQSGSGAGASTVQHKSRPAHTPRPAPPTRRSTGSPLSTAASRCCC